MRQKTGGRGMVRLAVQVLVFAGFWAACVAGYAKEGPELQSRETFFRVWAPHAQSVDVVGDFNSWRAGRNEMKRMTSDREIWEASVRGTGAGDAYHFVINGNLNRRDPRGEAVSDDGEHSLLYDQSVFNWQADCPLTQDMDDLVIYELHVGTFYDPRPTDGEPGTFYDAIKKLKLIKALGVNCVCVMPVHEFKGRHSWGYNPCDIYTVETAYGGNDGLKAFVQACHKLGIAVHLDIVHNHYGPQHLDLLQFDGTGEKDCGGIYFYDGERAMTPWGPRPCFERPAVRRFIKDNVDMWLRDYHIDGFRWDSTVNIRAYNMGENDLPDGARMLDDLNAHIHKTYPGRVSIAEDSLDIGTFDGSWEYDFHHDLMPVFKARNDADRDMYSVIAAVTRVPSTMRRVIYTDNHDEAGKINGQVRIASDIDPDDPDSEYAEKLSGLAGVLTLTSYGIPLLFMGNEMLESGTFHDDQPLHWNNWKSHDGLVRLHKDLIALRRNLRGAGNALKGEVTEVAAEDHDAKTVAFWRYEREYPEDRMVVAYNFSGQKQTVVVPFPSEGRWIHLLNTDWQQYGGASRPGKDRPFSLKQADKAEVLLAPYSARIFGLRDRPVHGSIKTASAGDMQSSASSPARDPDAPLMTFYEQIALAANFNEWSGSELKLKLVGDYTWEGLLKLPDCEAAEIQLWANGDGMVKWGGSEAQPSLTLPMECELKWHGIPFGIGTIDAGWYRVCFNENSKHFSMKKASEEIGVRRAAEDSVVEMRVWQDRSGKKVRAGYLAYANKKVQLQLGSSKTLWINVNKLSRPDQKYVLEQMRKDESR